ncbi:MAG TPA: serine/threonine-protein kinase [Pyrinomonadaceae bacterium]|nr:serine/threonine-protein kinase [Pyrinomonadaceae bacterium]
MDTNNDRKSNSRERLLAAGAILQSRYRIVRQIGRGGVGAVYEAVDLRLGHTVAVKQTLTEDERLWKQLEQEARLMAQLNHPVLPRVSDYFTEGNRAFFVMEFVEGRDLAEIMAQHNGPLPQQSVVAWADQLLDALVYLHSQDRQIIHRDIKPHNLKVSSTGEISLLDFGLAKSGRNDHEDDETSRSVFGYSPRYAPLEQIQDLGTTPQSDIYALGATLYHLLTGIKPPDALTRATALISSQPNPLRLAHELNCAVGLELSAILGRAMEQNPNQRYRSAKEFREALRCVGRVCADAAHHEDTGSTLAVGNDLTLVGPGVHTRLGNHAMAAVFVILLASFAVFCRYYSWNVPVANEPAMTVTNLSAATSADPEQNRTSRVKGLRQSVSKNATASVRKRKSVR